MTSDEHAHPFRDLIDPNMIEVGVGEFAVAKHPEFLMTPALGSCVAVALWDITLRQGGLAHVMLPTPMDTMMLGKEMRFASFAVPAMVDALANLGTPRRRLVAKIAGGATMFRADTLLAGVGSRNVAEVKNQLGLLGIPIHAEDIGERHARTVELHLDTGKFTVRSYLYGVKEL